jgi:hypothetical protein
MLQESRKPSHKKRRAHHTTKGDFEKMDEIGEYEVKIIGNSNSNTNRSKWRKGAGYKNRDGST